MVFDAITELHHAGAASTVTLFSRYWVSTSFYQIGVIWAEPHGRGLVFPAYPPSLRISVADSTFKIHHDIATNLNGTFDIPTLGQLVFTNLAGDFPLSNLRFSEAAARNWSGFHPRFPSSSNHFASNATSGRGSLDVILRGATPVASVLRNRRAEVVQSNAYSFLNEQSLQHTLTHLAERPIQLKLPSGDARIRVNGTDHVVEQIWGREPAGGRRINIRYENEGRLTVPKSIVTENTEGTAIHSVNLLNFKVLELSELEAEAAAHTFTQFGPELLKYRELLAKYWGKDPDDVSSEDADQARVLCSTLASGNSSSSPGEELRRLNALMEMYRLLGDDRRLVDTYQHYLSLMGTKKLTTPFLAGGYGALDTLALWGRTNTANLLLKCFLDEAPVHVDSSSLRKFSYLQLKKGNYWGNIQLIHAFLTYAPQTGAPKFELVALRACMAAYLHNLIKKIGETEELLPLAQARWALSSAAPSEIESIGREEMAVADQLFSQLEPTELSPLVREMKARIDSLRGSF